jgi:hypothetical protein
MGQGGLDRSIDPAALVLFSALYSMRYQFGNISGSVAAPFKWCRQQMSSINIWQELLES